MKMKRREFEKISLEARTVGSFNVVGWAFHIELLGFKVRQVLHRVHLKHLHSSLFCSMNDIGHV